MSVRVLDRGGVRRQTKGYIVDAGWYRRCRVCAGDAAFCGDHGFWTACRLAGWGRHSMCLFLGGRNLYLDGREIERETDKTDEKNVTRENAFQLSWDIRATQVISRQGKNTSKKEGEGDENAE